MTNKTVLQLKSNSKADNTKRRYNCTNYKFILWLFEHKEIYVVFIKKEFMGLLVVANERDLDECSSQEGVERNYKHF